MSRHKQQRLKAKKKEKQLTEYKNNFNKKLLALLGIAILILLAFQFIDKPRTQRIRITGHQEIKTTGISNNTEQLNSVSAQTYLTRNKEDSQQKDSSAIEVIQTNTSVSKSSKTSPKDEAIILLNKGELLYKNGLVEDAILIYKKALEFAPEDEDIHYNLAIAYAKIGDTNSAIKHYQEALKIVPEHLETRNNLGNLLAKLGRYKEAEEHFKYALNIMPDDAQLHNNYGTLLGLQGKHKDAIREFRAALKFDPDYTEAHFNLASALMMQEEYDEAIAEFQKLLAKHPDMQIVKKRLELLQKLKSMKQTTSSTNLQQSIIK